MSSRLSLPIGAAASSTAAATQFAVPRIQLPVTATGTKEGNPKESKYNSDNDSDGVLSSSSSSDDDEDEDSDYDSNRDGDEAKPRKSKAVFPAPNGPQVAAPKVTPGAAALAPGRKKVALKPGFSPLDWARYKASGAPELRDEQPGAPPSSQRYGGMRRITMEELKQHGRNAASQWTAIGGKVYNITPYLDYHPGGRADLLKIAGKDGTKLFMYYHMWVNPDALLDTCFLGMLEK